MYLPSITSGQMYFAAVNAVPVPGDFDGDGDVDGADFVSWQTNFPKTSGATLAQGDADADGDVDGADFVVWQTHFPTAANPEVVPVPEPAAINSCACVVAMLFAVKFNRSAATRR
jgi:hypothetical protein